MKTYPCDPRKNVKCRKNACVHEGKGECWKTSHEEFKMVPGANETRIGHCSYAWVCEKCELTWQFDWEGPQEHGVKYCPSCGRRIVEFVKYKDPFDDYVEEDADA